MNKQTSAVPQFAVAAWPQWAELDLYQAMNISRQKFFLITLILLGVAILHAPQGLAAPPAPTHVTILPDLPGWEFTSSGINNKGAVIGMGIEYDESGNVFFHGLVFDHGVYTIIDPPEAGSPLAFIQLIDINNRGEIIGVGYDSEFLSYAFVYEKGVYTTIEVPGSAPNTTNISHINDRGQIVGSYGDTESTFHAFLFDAGVYTTIDPPGSVSSQAFDINNRGQIVGQYVSVDTANHKKSHGFIYDKGVYTSLDHPDVVQSNFSNGTNAYLINDKGQIVGGFYDSNFNARLFLYQKGAYTTIDILGADYSFVYGINDRGQIVGSYGRNFINHGFLDDNGAYTTIDVHAGQPGSGTILTGINDGGKIVGFYQLFDDDFTYFYQYNFVLSH